MLACYTQRVWICLVGSCGETFEVIWRISRGAQASCRQGAFEWHKTKVQQSTKTKGWLQVQQNVTILRITGPADNNRVAKKQEIGIHHLLVSRTQIGYLPEKLWTQKAFGKRKKNAWPHALSCLPCGWMQSWLKPMWSLPGFGYAHGSLQEVTAGDV